MKPNGVPLQDAGPRPRERIIDAARELFHKHGFRAVGVDAIAEAAGTNKMTLYRHFASKDDLIVECLHRFAAEADKIWTEPAMAHPGDYRAQLRAWLERAAACVDQDTRGCDFLNAAVELAEPGHPARRVIEHFKIAYRERLVGLCRAAGASQAELMADTMLLLFDGARVSRQSVGAEGPSGRFIRLGESVIASFLDSPDPVRE
jgi:AcrR family transcriptional regulator